MPLQLETRRVGKVTIVKCAGRVVAGNEVEQLQKEISAHLPEYRHFVLHLEGVNFIDSSGLGLLVRLAASARSARGDLRLCNPSREVAHVLQITNLNRVLESHGSEADAITAFYQRGSEANIEGKQGKTVVCVDESTNVLAYVRELLRHAGFDPVTTPNLVDARILIKAARPAVVILGPSSSGRQNEKAHPLKDVLQGIPTITLDGSFSTADAGEAAQHVLDQVRAHTASS